MKRIILFVVILLISCSSQKQNAAEVKEEIQNIINQQQNAWNEGNIEGFMEYYWNSDEFTFQSGNNRIRGWQSLLDRYKKNYSGEKTGTLNFSDIEINVLTDEYVYVLGKWKVELADTTNQGLFTLLFKQLPEGWRIINDHTSQ